MSWNALFKFRLCVGALAVATLVMTLGFNVLLSVSTLDRLATDSLLSGYRAAGGHLAQSVERGLRFGKPLEQYAGMGEMLRDLQDGTPGILAAEIVDAGGNVLYAVREQGGPGANEDRQARRAHDRKVLGGGTQGGGQQYWAGPRTYRIVVALHHNGVVGGVALEVAASRITAATQGFIRWAVALLALACLVAGATLAAWIGLLTSTPEARSRLGRSLGMTLLVLIGGMQIAYSAAMLSLFDSFLQNAMRDKAALAARFLKRDFEYIVHKGVDVRGLQGGKELLERIVGDHPELSGASLSTPDGVKVASAGKTDDSVPVLEESFDRYWPSRFRQREAVLHLRLYMNQSHLADNVRALGVDLATSMAISLLLLLELARIMGLLSSRMLRAMPDQAHVDGAPLRDSSAQALRTGGFLFFLAYDMGISFIPVLARARYAPLWGLPEQVLVGLPISAEMICAGAALLVAGMVSERFGWRTTFVVGVAAAAMGLFVGGASASLGGLIASRGICGFGFGLVLMAAQIGTLDEEDAGYSLAGVFAGIFAGSICGAAIGALLAERIGFDLVFSVAACLIPVALLILFFGRPRRVSGGLAHAPAHSVAPGGASGEAWNFLRDPRMHVLLGMIGIPAALCLTGFLHYLLPLMLTEVDTSPSDIGRLFMLYGLCFITVGPMLGRWLDRSPRKDLFAMCTGLLSGAALLIFAVSPTLTAAALSVAVIGTAQCLAAPATMMCVIGLASSRRLGRGKTASVYRTLERSGQVLGPVLFGVALVRCSVTWTLVAAGVTVCVLALAFPLCWRISRGRQ